jgi:hypothetical protein
MNIMYNVNVAQCCTKWKKIQRRVYCVDITWMYEVRGMVNNLDIVWHVYSTTYDCRLYRLTFWWSIDLTYKYLWHALFMVNSCHLDLTTDNKKVALSGMLVCSYALISTGYVEYTPSSKERESWLCANFCATNCKPLGVRWVVYLEGLAQHVPAITTETVEWCAPAVLRLAWCETFCHRVDPS